MIREILIRVPPKHLLRCRAVCKAWRDLASDRKLLLDHHRRQPRQPLITLFHYSVNLPTNCLEAVDLTTNKRRMVARFVDRVFRELSHDVAGDLAHSILRALAVHGSCDGLLLLSYHEAFFICNPTTRQGTLLPQLDDHEIAGFYPHAASGEYRVLYHRDDGLERKYYVLTVGSQQARNIELRASSASVVEGLARGLARSCVRPPVILHGSLHWSPPRRQEGNILVFDTAAESFRWISPPAAPIQDNMRLFEMEGKLAMFCWKQDVWISDLWPMRD